MTCLARVIVRQAEGYQASLSSRGLGIADVVAASCARSAMAISWRFDARTISLHTALNGALSAAVTSVEIYSHVVREAVLESH